MNKASKPEQCRQDRWVKKMTNVLELEKFSKDETLHKLQNIIKEETLKKEKEFNIFKVLKLDNYEIRHSNFLAWLLNPNETHGFNTLFLNQFLKTALNKDVSDLINGQNVTIETEYPTNEGRRIDILIHTKDFVCVIENKYGSEEHDGQCKHYKKFIENDSKFKNCGHKYYIFLDINKPNDEQLQNSLNCYQPIIYKDVYQILVNLLEEKEENITLQIIRQYIEIIKEKYIMLNAETKKQCRELYSKYKNVFDLMEKFNSEFQNDIYNIMQEIVSSPDLSLKNADIKGNGYNNNTGCGIRFILEELTNEQKIQIKNNVTNYSLFFALEYKKEFLLSIYSIELGDKWINHKAVSIDFENKSDEEIKAEIISKINELRPEIINLANN